TGPSLACIGDAVPVDIPISGIFDTVSDASERRAGTFPYKADSDGDGVDDRSERDAGTNPIDPKSL
ncbi:MAG: thrombospondin type 3 repeat-containing protein, partial [Pseudomonadota bacterium]